MVIRISRHGMTRCPSCDRHFLTETIVSESTCPFCRASLTSAAGSGTRSPGLLGRTGNALAASLVSLGLGSACLDDGARDNDAVDSVDAVDSNTGDATDVSDVRPDATPDTTDTTPQPLYGAPMDIVDAEDTLPQPEYGLPMEDVKEDTGGTVDAGPTEDVPFVPLYGLPPSDTIQPAEDVLPQPEYGLPMEDVKEDTGASHDAGATDARDDEIVPVPLYGLPPE
jgi:hypothetical protein